LRDKIKPLAVKDKLSSLDIPENTSFAEFVNNKFNLGNKGFTYHKPYYPPDSLPCDSMGAKDGEHRNDETHVCSSGRQPGRTGGPTCSLDYHSSKTRTDDDGAFSKLYGLLPGSVNIPDMLSRVDKKFHETDLDQKLRTYPYLVVAELLRETPGNLTAKQFEPFWKAINELHADDIATSKKKCMVFKKIGFNHFKIGPYTTRFTNKDYRKKQYQKLSYIFDYTAKVHKRAVFLTLTLAPSKELSLFDLNKSARTAAIKLIRLYLKRLDRQGVHCSYVMVPEYQKNGRIHFHVMIFGTSRLDYYKKVQKIASSVGLGWADVVPLYSDNGYWHRKGDSNDTSKYLSYYLRKSIADPHVASLYWANNQKFFSNSEEFNHTDLDSISIFKTLFASDYRYLGTYQISTVKQVFDGIYCFKSPHDLSGWGLEPPDSDKLLVSEITIELTEYNEELAAIFPDAKDNKPETLKLINDSVLFFYLGRYFKLPGEAVTALFQLIETNKEFASAVGVIADA